MRTHLIRPAQAAPASEPGSRLEYLGDEHPTLFELTVDVDSEADFQLADGQAKGAWVKANGLLGKIQRRIANGAEATYQVG
jgi:hypothetical protein